MARKKEIYFVEGMSCAGCERAIQTTVKNIEGVNSAKADLTSATVEVEFDTDKTNIEEIKSAVNNLGYKFIGERPAFGHREERDDAVA